MGGVDLVVAVLAGLVQGILEWLPVSSQGNLAAVLTAVGTDPEVAVQLALFLQVGTSLSAATYYREEVETAVRRVPAWRPGSAYEGQNALPSYLGVATVLTGVVGVPLYVFAVDLAGELTGGAFVALVGALLVLTGGLQLVSDGRGGTRGRPTLLDSVLVGAAQGVAILPGVSRSGVTTSALLFRRYDPPAAFRLSFLLSIPATAGAAVLTVAENGGLPGIDPLPAAVALSVSAAVGYLSIDTLVRVVDRIQFWLVCFGLGGVAIAGGVLAVVLS
jgi:undecaprenyl-diphosphatase